MFAEPPMHIASTLQGLEDALDPPAQGWASHIPGKIFLPLPWPISSTLVAATGYLANPALPHPPLAKGADIPDQIPARRPEQSLKRHLDAYYGALVMPWQVGACRMACDAP